MTLEESLHQQLLRSPHITAMVGPRIWHGRLPPHSFQRGSTRPALTYWRVTGRRSVTPIIESRGGELRVQLDCWAKTDTDVRALRNAVRLALHGFHGLLGGGVAVSNRFREYPRHVRTEHRNLSHCHGLLLPLRRREAGGDLDPCRWPMSPSRRNGNRRPTVDPRRELATSGKLHLL